MRIEVARVKPELARKIALLTGELLEEIMQGINVRAFDFELDAAESRLNDYLTRDKYFVFAAVQEDDISEPVGFISMYESYSLYAGGAFGTIPELYVQPSYRKQGLGKLLIDAAKEFGARKGWTRLEVTTPPLPAFQSTLDFYEREGFSVSGGRKLQTGL